MRATSSELALFFELAKGIIEGLKATYEEDSLIAKNDEFEDETFATSKRFKTKLRIFMHSQIARIQIENKVVGSKFIKESISRD